MTPKTLTRLNLTKETLAVLKLDNAQHVVGGHSGGFCHSINTVSCKNCPTA